MSDTQQRDTTPWASIGLQHQTQGRHREAEQAYRRFLTLDPRNPEVHYNLGLVLQELGRIDEALAHYDRALEQRPTFASASFNRGNALAGLGRQHEAIVSYRRAIEHDPNHARARLHLAYILGEQGHIDEALAHGAELIDRGQNVRETHAMLLFLEQFRFGATIRSLNQLHAEWDARYTRPLIPAMPTFANDFRTDRRLRLGLVSGDLRNHAVGHCLTPILEHFDRDRFELTAYSNSAATSDPWRQRLLRCFDRWRDVLAWDDEQLAQNIRNDQIDIVLDLSGHTSGNRLLALARRPAPLQLSWLGYTFPTTIDAIDGHLADSNLVPDEYATEYRAPIVRLPRIWTAYEVEQPWPAITPPPSTARGYITFGSFNKPNKLNAAVIAVWAEIMLALPTSRLLLKYRGLNDSVTSAYFRRQFQLYGVDPRRIDCEGHTSFESMLKRYGEIDIALDTFPYSGGITSLTAAWMGVPVVTWPGELIASRQTAAIMQILGEPELVATDRQDYVRRAVELAEDQPRLTRLRETLRESYRNSPLARGELVASDLADTLCAAWRERCSRR